jgi:secreted trypsin-like serine protease
MQKHFRILAMTGVIFFAACSADNNDSSDTSIIGGRLADYHSFMVRMSDDGDDKKTGYCGGSWIADGVILTAAHCVADMNDPAKVSVSITRESDISAATSVKVRAIVPHPEFDPEVMHNDVALLFVDKPDHANLRRPVRPIVLNTERSLPEDNGTVTVIGWGNESSYGFLFGDELRQVDMPVIGLDQCRGAGGFYATVSDNEVCAGDFDRGGIDSCQGDSGGPLITMKDGQPVLVGVVSWGINCANKGKPGVYARVSSYTGWIYEQIGKYSAALAESEAGLKAAVAQHCYTGLSAESLPYPDDIAFEVKSSFKVDQSLTRLSGVPAVAQPAVSCAFNRTGLGDVRVDIAQDSDQPAVHIALANGNTWTGAVSVARSLETPCTDGTDSYTIELNNSSSWIRAEGSWFMVGDVVENPDLTGFDQKTCKTHETTLTFAKKTGDNADEVSYLATVASPEIGKAATTYKLKKSSFSAGKRISAAADFPDAARTEGTLTFQNTTEEDIHTWVLSCPVEFTLTDVYGAVYQPVEKSGSWLHSFLTPASIHGIIARDASVRFSVKYKAAFDADAFNRCTVNSMPFTTTVTGPSGT